MLRVLIADDSLIYRMVLKKLLSALDDVEVCASVSNGRAALREIKNTKPDVVLLDVEMPVMDGMTVMRELQSHKERPDVIMCSAFTVEGADITIKALELGACDFITKPEGKSREDSEIQLLRQACEAHGSSRSSGNAALSAAAGAGERVL